MTDAPVVVIAIFRPLAGARDGVLAALGRAIPQVHEEEGCTLYSIQEAADGVIWMVEHWASQALLAAHGAGQPVADLNADLEGLLTEPVEVITAAPIPFGDPAKGLVRS